MFDAISQSRRFLAEWILLNLAGFVIGSLLGATDFSLVSNILGQSLGARVIGDVLFGGTIGAAQYLALRRHFPASGERLIWWIPASIVGFVIGARLGTRFAPAITTQEIPLAIVFGIFLGGSFGITHWAAMRVIGTLKADKPAAWIPACICAWMIAEIIGFTFDFSQLAVPLLGAAIALITGIALVVWIRPR